MKFIYIPRLFFLLLISIFALLGCNAKKKAEKEMIWENPISKGISPYGMKDFHLFYDEGTYFMTGTEYNNPIKGYLGPNLYKSTNLNTWEIAHKLIDISKIPEDAWYKNGWFAPEIKKIKNKYYFTFNNRNNTQNPYQKTGFGIAVSETLLGEYKVINTKKPVVLSNHGSLSIGKNEDEVFLTYDMDGRIFIAEINLEKATLKTKPQELLGPETLGNNYKYLDAPQITKTENLNHMLFSQFYGGYVVKVFHMTANTPKGPWEWDENNPMYTFMEAEADLKVKNEYPTKHGYAPPTQVIFSNQLFLGENGQYFNAFHSSEKYSEPYLCIEPVEVIGKTLKILNSKSNQQKVSLK